MTRAVIAQLLATRDTLVAAVSQIDAALLTAGIDPETGEGLRGESSPCTHPKVIDLSTMGEELFKCEVCEEEFSEDPRTTSED